MLRSIFKSELFMLVAAAAVAVMVIVLLPEPKDEVPRAPGSRAVVGKGPSIPQVERVSDCDGKHACVERAL